MSIDLFFGLEPWRIIAAVTMTTCMVLAVLRERHRDR